MIAFKHEEGKKYSVTAIVAMVLGGIGIAVLMAFLLGAFVMLLWNALMPDIFGLKEIGYWQAWGLVLLSHILFKGGHHDPDHRGRGKRRGHWKDYCGKAPSEDKGSGETAGETHD